MRILVLLDFSLIFLTSGLVLLDLPTLNSLGKATSREQEGSKKYNDPHQGSVDNAPLLHSLKAFCHTLISPENDSDH